MEIFLQTGLDSEIAQQPAGQISQLFFPLPLWEKGKNARRL
jgi:hypothetical protein